MSNDSDRNLPDISGIFDIDESKIPSKIIEKPAESRPAAEPVLLRTEQKQPRQERRINRERPDKQPQSRRKTKKKRDPRIIAIAAAVFLLLAFIFFIKTVISVHRRPTAQLATAETMTISLHYDNTAVMLRENAADGGTHTELAFAENSYDTYPLQKDQKVEITVEEGRTVTGIVSAVTKEEAGSPLIATLLQFLPDAAYSSATNYVVHIMADSYEGLEANNTYHVKVIISNESGVVAIPQEAVFQENSDSYVWLYRSFGNKIKKQVVGTGICSDGFIKIGVGIEEGQQVAYGFSCDPAELKDGQKIKKAKTDTETDAAEETTAQEAE
ncbi:MAG: hypothetical protein IJJ85_02885 [Clostridia bacterium]|nr:hypothetical protein [Clostridia bacterium]